MAVTVNSFIANIMKGMHAHFGNGNSGFPQSDKQAENIESDNILFCLNLCVHKCFVIV